MTSKKPSVQQKTLVLVLGAGSSKEVGLPVGDELKHQIAKRLNFHFDKSKELNSGDIELVQAFNKASIKSDGTRGDITPLLSASRLIHDAMPLAISIDNFIDSHRNNENIALCGKLAIAQCILKAESDSRLFVNPSNINNKLNFEAIENTWFKALFQLLTENCQRADIKARLDKIAVINFNYDRCLEHYLFLAFQNYYEMSANEATQLVASLEIHHPYGKVGSLPWMEQTGGHIAYGATPNHQQLIDISKLLRTFTEGTDPSVSNIDTIRDTVARAERLLFLGFAFHRLNLDLLFSGLPSNTKKVFATALNISNSNREQIHSELVIKAKHPNDFIHIRNDLTCTQLFSEYSRNLSMTE